MSSTITYPVEPYQTVKVPFWVAPTQIWLVPASFWDLEILKTDRGSFNGNLSRASFLSHLQTVIKFFWACEAQMKFWEDAYKVLAPGMNLEEERGSYGASVFGSQTWISSDELDEEQIKESENYRRVSLNNLNSGSVVES